MAWTASGLYYATWVDALDATQLLLNLSLQTHKVAMYNTNASPNFATDAAYTSANEVSGTGYTAGGHSLTGLNPSVAYTSDSGGVLRYKHDAVSWLTSSIPGACGAIWYADANTAGDGVADALIFAVNFGGAYTSVGGTFTITPNTAGLFVLDLTP